MGGGQRVGHQFRRDACPAGGGAGRGGGVGGGGGGAVVPDAPCPQGLSSLTCKTELLLQMPQGIWEAEEGTDVQAQGAVS